MLVSAVMSMIGSMSTTKARLTVTVDHRLVTYAEQLVEAGKADSVSAVLNSALAEKAARDRRIRRLWNEKLAQATPEDHAGAARMIAHVDAQVAQLPERFRR